MEKIMREGVQDENVQREARGECYGVIHVIEKGDTLYNLGRAYGVTVSAIMASNPYINIYNLQIGDEVCIPQPMQRPQIEIQIPRVTLPLPQPDMQQPQPQMPRITPQPQTGAPQPRPQMPRITPQPQTGAPQPQPQIPRITPQPQTGAPQPQPQMPRMIPESQNGMQQSQPQMPRMIPESQNGAQQSQPQMPRMIPESQNGAQQSQPQMPRMIPESQNGAPQSQPQMPRMMPPQPQNGMQEPQPQMPRMTPQSQTGMQQPQMQSPRTRIMPAPEPIQQPAESQLQGQTGSNEEVPVQRQTRQFQSQFEIEVDFAEPLDDNMVEDYLRNNRKQKIKEYEDTCKQCSNRAHAGYDCWGPDMNTDLWGSIEKNKRRMNYSFCASDTVGEIANHLNISIDDFNTFIKRMLD
jgi:LysM repeat protein